MTSSYLCWGRKRIEETSFCSDIVRSSYLQNGISYTGKTTSLYWISPHDRTPSEPFSRSICSGNMNMNLHFLSFIGIEIGELVKNLSAQLQWRHNGPGSVSNHQPHNCLLNRLFRRRSQKILKLRVTGLCAGNSPGTGEFPTQRATNPENVSIWWRHHAMQMCLLREHFHW